jgi:hypothetical protein
VRDAAVAPAVERRLRRDGNRIRTLPLRFRTQGFNAAPWGGRPPVEPAGDQSAVTSTAEIVRGLGEQVVLLPSLLNPHAFEGNR